MAPREGGACRGARLRAAYAGPAVYREPREGAGLTERSEAFFLLNRHRFGAVVAAAMGDLERRGRGGASDSGLRRYDGRGRGQALAGYGGEGPRGTHYVLRQCGFPEGREDDRGRTALERTVVGSRALILRRGAGAPVAEPGGEGGAPRAVGTRKLVYGSDLPVVCATYRIGRVLLAPIPEEDQRRILGGTMSALLATRRYP